MKPLSIVYYLTRRRVSTFSVEENSICPIQKLNSSFDSPFTVLIPSNVSSFGKVLHLKKQILIIIENVQYILFFHKLHAVMPLYPNFHIFFWMYSHLSSIFTCINHYLLFSKKQKNAVTLIHIFLLVSPLPSFHPL